MDVAVLQNVPVLPFQEVAAKLLHEELLHHLRLVVELNQPRELDLMPAADKPPAGPRIRLGIGQHSPGL